MLVTESEGKKREPIPADVYDAVCVTVAGIGTQVTKFGPKKKMFLGWELPEVVRDFDHEDGTVEKKRAVIHSRALTQGLGGAQKPTTLAEFLIGWRGRPFTETERKGFDVKNVLGKSCRINVTHDHVGDKVYDGVDSVLTAKNQITPEAKLVYFDVGEFDSLVDCDAALAEFPPTLNWLADKVRESEEYKALLLGHTGDEGSGVTDDDVPF